VADTADTESKLSEVPGLGLGTSVQLEPSQCSVRVVFAEAVPPLPTAHMSVADTASTAVSVSATGFVALLAEGTRGQAARMERRAAMPASA